MIIVCGICGEEMEAEYEHLFAGTSDDGYIVEPCCDTEETCDKLNDFEYLVGQANNRLDLLRDKLDELLEETQMKIRLAKLDELAGDLQDELNELLKT